MKYIPLLFVVILVGCSGGSDSEGDKRLAISDINFISEEVKNCVNSEASAKDLVYADELTEFTCYANSYNSNSSDSTEDLLLFPNIMTVELSHLESGFIDSSHFAKVSSFTLSSSSIEQVNIDELVNLQELFLSQNNNLKNINLTYNTKLKNIYINDNPLEALNIETLTELEKLQLLNFEDVQVSPTRANVPGIVRLTWGDITHINFDNNLKLRELTVIGNLLTNLSLANHSALTVVEVTDSKLQSVDFDLPALEKLNLSNNSLSIIDLSYAPNLTELTLSKNNLMNIDLSYSIDLKGLNLWKNNIKSIDLSNNLKLNYANLVENPLSEETRSYLETIDWVDMLEF
ncbi:hypothetical protein EKO29_01950 [Colwellia sp. Arc7-635]|uniref:hypothetical protein n=1 Tax=Colwellia sp. Arc7-635 TaxID=2497879 RepID=UPI000F850328|nr:hypothetical protein [Colwellia sp. Arc7-635]AZQ82928.1 hypothetical protein EKO29_01950 [Colwellia sp. Arc7-635]